jgi:hypothetical protein
MVGVEVRCTGTTVPLHSILNGCPQLRRTAGA